MAIIKGNVKYIIYESNNNYKVGQFYIKSTDSEELTDYINKTITFTGNFNELSKDVTYEFSGEYIYHDKYGYQFLCSSYKKELPTTKEALIEFLSSSIIKGCGEKTARSIVDVLGEDAINIIKTEPSKLLLVEKISEKKALIIYNSVMKYAKEDEMIVKLQQFGLSLKESLLLIEKYPDDLDDILENNIYELTEYIEFKKVDNIYLENNDYNSDLRIYACILESLKQMEFIEGDTYFFESELVSYLKKFNIEKDDIKIYLLVLKQDKKITVIEDKIYLYKTYEAEKNIANNLYLINKKPLKKMRSIDQDIERLEEEYNVKYNATQKKAIKKALENNITIITGGPGTGKTTIINAIVRLYINQNRLNNMDIPNHIALLAPTGRASKKIAESTNLYATTIHRYLKWNKETNTFSVDENNKNYQKLIIIDETSMIDVFLFDALLKGIYSDVKLIIVGDKNQLPSVGAGLILNDLIESKGFANIELTRIYRQSNNSYIPDLAKEIKEVNINKDFTCQKDDYNFLSVDDQYILETIKKIIDMSIKKGLNEKNIQVLAPMYKGKNGIDNLNIMLQSLLNKKDKEKKEIKVGEVIFREKDKVIQLVNDPDNNIFNGDIGYIHNIFKDGNNKDVVTIDFDGNYIIYKREDLTNIKHAYAMTIHKAQGSEFNHVIMPVCRSYNKMLYNKLIYTGVSRAKKSLVIIGNPDVFIEASKNMYSSKRKTTLKELIMNNL